MIELLLIMWQRGPDTLLLAQVDILVENGLDNVKLCFS